MGRHVFSYALFPHEGSPLAAETTKAALNYNTPLLTALSTGGSTSCGVARNVPQPAIFRADETPGVILDAIKIAEDGDGVVIRLYEAHGGRVTAVVKSDVAFGSAHRCNLMEECLLDVGAEESLEADFLSGVGTTLRVTLRPFEICTIRLRESHYGSTHAKM